MEIMDVSNSNNWPTYQVHPDDDFKLHGFCRLIPTGDGIDRMCAAGINISERSNLLRERKDAGALQVDKVGVNQNISYYSDLLTRTGLFHAAHHAAGKMIFPRKISHTISDLDTKPLIWHRDSYRHLGKQIGPLPSPIKLAVYLTDVDADSGVTGIQTYLTNTDFNNRYIDTLVAYLLQPRAFSPRMRRGSAILFDGRLLHCRTRHRAGTFRCSVIFSLSQDLEQLEEINDPSNAPFGLLEPLMQTDTNFCDEINRVLSKKK